MRRFSERIASFAPTVLDRILSDISRFAAISSLKKGKYHRNPTSISTAVLNVKTYKELDVALSICSSSCEEDANHPDIMLGRLQVKLRDASAIKRIRIFS
jgi:hypothetical protein